MTNSKASASAVIPAPPAAVYALLADYREGHPSILPPQYFSDLVVEEGGVGEGTIIRFTVHVARVKRQMRARVSEPEPGRTLAETDLDSGGITRFVMEPVGDGQQTSLTIVTEWSRPGMLGMIERFSVPPLLRKIYKEELRRVATHFGSSSR